MYPSVSVCACNAVTQLPTSQKKWKENLKKLPVRLSFPSPLFLITRELNTSNNKRGKTKLNDDETLPTRVYSTVGEFYFRKISSRTISI
jgi:hypothetical protein